MDAAAILQAYLDEVSTALRTSSALREAFRCAYLP
jgi:hypothetical protein